MDGATDACICAFDMCINNACLIAAQEEYVSGMLLLCCPGCFSFCGTGKQLASPIFVLQLAAWL